MKIAPALEYPPDLEQTHRKARRLAWITLAYLVTVGIVLYLVLGSSQAMKAAWIEDLLSMVPPIVYLIGDYYARKDPKPKYPFGYHRGPSVAFLGASGALLLLGLWLLYDSAIGLIRHEVPTIGGITLFGETIWLGWLMIGALVYSGVPAVFLGIMQSRNGRKLHDKVLYADGSMRKADWLTSTSAIVGILGIGMGYWWADAAAAIIISLDIIHDGWVHMRTAIGDLMDRQPTTVEGKPSELPDRIRKAALALDWVSAVEVRVRESGHVHFAEVFVIPERETDTTPGRIDAAASELESLDWRIANVAIIPVVVLDRRGGVEGSE